MYIYIARVALPQLPTLRSRSFVPQLLARNPGLKCVNFRGNVQYVYI